MREIIDYGWYYFLALVNGNLDRYFPTDLQEAAYYGYTGTVQTELDKGANVDEEGLIGMSPLCAALYGGQEETAHLLLENGACVRGWKVGKALRYAKAHGYSGVVRLVTEACEQKFR